MSWLTGSVAIQPGRQRRRSRRNGRSIPGWGSCYACGTAWKFVREHVTDYTESSGCFPLCEPCWAERTPAERLPFYEQLWATWQRCGSPCNLDKWEQIERAVLAGR